MELFLGAAIHRRDQSPTPSLQDLVCRPVSAGDASVDSPVITGGIGCLSCEEQSVVEWSAEHLQSAVRTHFRIAVGSARKGIRLPVMKVRIQERMPYSIEVHTQQPR